METLVYAVDNLQIAIMAITLELMDSEKSINVNAA
jgi:hypothetical protein